MAYRLSIAGEEDKENIRLWRNQPQVRAVMRTNHEISVAEHQNWWDRLNGDETQQICLLRYDFRPVAVINLFDIQHSQSLWWGFYLTDQDFSASDSMRIWLDCEAIVLRYAFEIFQVQKVYCETFSDNEQVLLLHERFGFVDNEEQAMADGRRLVIKFLERSIFEANSKITISDAAAAAVFCGHNEPQRIAVAGPGNWRAIENDLLSGFAQFSDWPVSLLIPDYGQAQLQLRDPKSQLCKFEPDITVLCWQFEDFSPPFRVFDEEHTKIILGAFESYLEQIGAARNLLGGTLLVFDIAPVASPVAGMNKNLETLVDNLNQGLSEHCGQIPDCHLLPYSEMIARVGQNSAAPGKYGLIGRFPLGAKAIPACCDLIIGAIAARTGRAARALVLDLDNTLWGGVLGDDGISGLQLGPDFPGNQYIALQEYLAAWQKTGLPLAICSKNDESFALKAMRELTDFRLDPNAFAALRINWRPKSENIREIAEEIGLAVENLMIIDDNAFERHEIRANCPGAMVPEMPLDVADWPGFLTAHPALQPMASDASAASRSNSYQIRQNIAAMRGAGGDVTAYLHGLGLRLDVSHMTHASQQRAIELFAKTNQFNTRGIRYTEAQLQELLGKGGAVYTARLRDNLGSDEIIAALTLTPATVSTECANLQIENFVLSCRVMGRGVETAILSAVSDKIGQNNVATLMAEINLTDRNEPCRNVYLENGFTEIGPLKYSLDLPSGAVQCPPWVQLV